MTSRSHVHKPNSLLKQPSMPRGPPRGPTAFISWAVRHSRFEVIFAVLILLNAVVMAFDMQVKSRQTAYDIDFNGARQAGLQRWPIIESVFPVLEVFFGSLFMLEVLMKLVALRRHFFFQAWNVFDTLIVSFWFVGLFAGSGLLMNPMLLRLLRLFRLVRLLRLVRAMEMFDTLLLMVASIKASISILLWGTILLVTIMMMSSLVLNSMLVPVMLDAAEDLENRRALYLYFGSISRSMVTMYEITLGNYVPACRVLMEVVSEWYGLACIIYRSIVGFAVVKVITGVFMHETFRAASQDDDLLIRAKERARKRHMSKMHSFFDAADIDHDGKVSRQEFLQILKVPRVSTWLSAMEIPVTEPHLLFDHLVGVALNMAEGGLTGAADEMLSVKELSEGVARLCGPAQQFNVVQLLRQDATLEREIKVVSEKISAYLLHGMSASATTR